MFDVALAHIHQLMQQQIRAEAADDNEEEEGARVVPVEWQRLHAELLQHFGEETQLVTESRTLAANCTRLRSELRVANSHFERTLIQTYRHVRTQKAHSQGRNI